MRFVNLAVFFMCFNFAAGIIVPEMGIFEPQLATYSGGDTDSKWADFSAHNPWVGEATTQQAQDETHAGVVGAVEQLAGYARLVLSAIVGFAKLLVSMVDGLGKTAQSAGLHPMYRVIIDTFVIAIYMLARYEIKSGRKM